MWDKLLCSVIIIRIMAAEDTRHAMRSTTWQGIPSIQEVECSGRTLSADSDVLSMALFSVANNTVLASVNMRKTECGTSFAFSACNISHDSRSTRLVTLVMNLEEGETRDYGCNITSFKTGGHSVISTWSLQVQLGPGLKAVQFRDFPSVTEVICEADATPPNSDVMSLSLFTIHDGKVLCFVNIAKEACSISDVFASCVINKEDSRSTEARSLLIGLKEGEVMLFGCNVTFASAKMVNAVSWFLELKGMNMACCCVP